MLDYDTDNKRKTKQVGLYENFKNFVSTKDFVKRVNKQVTKWKK